MTVDLASYWRSGISDGKLKVPAYLLNRFLNWLEIHGIAAENLDRERYRMWFAEMALEGRKAREFGTTDIRIRGLYRSAVRDGLLPSLPMGDIPISKLSKPQGASITEGELVAMMERSILEMQDESVLIRNRAIFARAGLAVSLAYYSGLTAQHMTKLRVEQLMQVLARQGLPDVFLRLGQAYQHVRSKLPGGPLDVLIPSSRLPPAAIKTYNQEVWDSTATCAPIATPNIFLQAVVDLAARLDLHAPERFTPTEILRLRKANLYSLVSVDWPDLNVISAPLTKTRTPQDWSEHDIMALVTLHPRSAEL